MSLIRNERIKLFASALNHVAVATIVTAIVVPSISFLYNPPWPMGNHWWLFAGAVWLGVGTGLHVMAIIVLGRLTSCPPRNFM
jgi:hypothetical protein